MKKLKLNLQYLQNAEVLTRSQLKNVLGGDPLVTTAGDHCWCSHFSDGTFEWYSCGKTQSQAMADANYDVETYGNGHYCHDSCGVADPCNP